MSDGLPLPRRFWAICAISFGNALTVLDGSIVMVGVPAPLTLAPILFRQSAKSAISGSQAEFVITVWPFASTAASRVCSVAPTDTNGNSISPPFRPRGACA